MEITELRICAIMTVINASSMPGYLRRTQITYAKLGHGTVRLDTGNQNTHI